MLVSLSQIGDSLADVQKKTELACARAKRSLTDVQIMAVTKNVPLSHIQEIFKCGIQFVGENRVQEAAGKISAWPPDSQIRDCPFWHLIGHLQTNKVKKALDLFSCVQSVDSMRLAEALNQEGKKRGQPVNCLLEVKVSEEATKYGISPQDMSSFLEQMSALPFLKIDGLMTMAPFFDVPEKTRPYFRAAKNCFEQHKHSFASAQPILSMGMSQDFEVAVEEGATMIRIGSALFGARQPHQ